MRVVIILITLLSAFAAEASAHGPLAPGNSPSPSPSPTPGNIPGPFGRTTGGWTAWWGINRDRFLTGPSGDIRGSEQGNASRATTPEQERALRKQITSMLRKGLDDDDYQVRAHALMALAKVGPPASLEDLMKGVRDDDYRVRQAAVVALGVFGDAHAEQMLLAILEGEKAARKAMGLAKKVKLDTRVFAALSLGLLGEQTGGVSSEGLEALRATLTRENRSVELNAAAAIALGMMRDTGSVELLTGYLGDRRNDTYIRAFCATSLGRLGDRRALPALVAAVKDKKSSVRGAAAAALGQIAGPDDREALVALRRSATARDVVQRNLSIMALGEVGGPAARETLMAWTSAGDDELAGWATLSLGVLGRKHHDDGADKVSAHIRKTMKTTRTPGRKAACCLALGLLGDGNAADELEEIALEGAHAEVRAHAVLGLGLLGARKSLEKLAGRLEREKNPSVVRAAATAYGLAGDPGASSRLKRRLLGDRSIGDRGIEELGLGGKNDIEAAWALGKTLSDSRSQDRIRALAARGLGLLGDKSEFPLLAGINQGSNFYARRGALLRLDGQP